MKKKGKESADLPKREHDQGCDGSPWGKGKRCKCSYYKKCPNCHYLENGANSRHCAHCNFELRGPNKREPQKQCGSCSQMFIDSSFLISIPISVYEDSRSESNFVSICDKCAPDWFEKVQKLWAQFKKEKDR